MPGYSSIKSVAQRYDKSPSTIWRWCNEKRFAHLGFPKPIPIGPNSQVLENDELDAYDEKRRALREAASE